MLGDMLDIVTALAWSPLAKFFYVWCMAAVLVAIIHHIIKSR